MRAESLAQLLINDPESVLVVDVRDKDFGTGRVRGSLHIPFNQFDVAQLCSRLNSDDIKDLVLHCHFSQMRAPSAANAVMEYFEKHGLFPKVKVSVLQGGFEKWHEEYHSNPCLYEALSSRSIHLV